MKRRRARTATWERRVRVRHARNAHATERPMRTPNERRMSRSRAWRTEAKSDHDWKAQWALWWMRRLSARLIASDLLLRALHAAFQRNQ